MLGFISKNLLIPFLISLHVISGVVIYIFVIHIFSRNSNNTPCNPSSCGSIDNIIFPYRLNTDPKHCGNPDYQLTCDEQNRTVLTLKSQKYYVQSINYDNYTVRVVNPGVQQNICSFPRYALAHYTFLRYDYSNRYDITTPIKMTPYGWQDSTSITVPIIFWRCPFQLKSSAFAETNKECWNKSSTKHSSGLWGYAYAYAKLCSLNASDLRISCRVELITMTSLQIQEKNVSRSLLEIHDALMYGFELSWFLAICQQHCGSNRCYLDASNKISCFAYTSGFGTLAAKIWFYFMLKIISKPKSNGQDFINEVASMGRIHHVNIVRLVGYCAQNSKCALVYDFMSNGSLDKYINEGADASLLNWQRKFEIAVGVARGIDYLHRGCDIQILHFDIKPHNILLDVNFIPKISDFGLAKLFPADKSIVTLTAARGIIGYVAPELINRSIGAISHKAGVYSFGMLLMEMLGLKKNPVIGHDESSQYFPSWIYNDINKGKAIEMGELDEDEKRITKKMTIAGLWCIQTSPIPRPLMSRVVEMLEGAVELLQMPTDDIFLSEPVMDVDQEQTSMPHSSESIAFLPNSVNSDSIAIILD